MRITFLAIFALLVCAGVGINMAQAASDKVAVCHVTGSEKNPVVTISVDQRSLTAHVGHGDTLLDPINGCSGDGGPGPVPE